MTSRKQTNVEKSAQKRHQDNPSEHHGQQQRQQQQRKSRASIRKSNSNIHLETKEPLIRKLRTSGASSGNFTDMGSLVTQKDESANTRSHTGHFSGITSGITSAFDGAATKIQTLWRGRDARKNVNQAREQKRKSMQLAQPAPAKASAATVRQGEPRPAPTQQEAATMIQSQWRGREAQKSVHQQQPTQARKRKSVHLTQPAPAQASKAIVHQEQQVPVPQQPKQSPRSGITGAVQGALESAATTIQSIWRGRSSRRNTVKLKSQRK